MQSRLKYLQHSAEAACSVHAMFTGTGGFVPIPKSTTRRQTKLKVEYNLLGQQARAKLADQSLRRTNLTRNREEIQGPGIK